MTITAANPLDFKDCVRQGKYYTQVFKKKLMEAGWDVRENNQDERDKTPDLYLYYNSKVFVPFEVKSLTTPFRNAARMVGIPPDKCVSIQTVELERCYGYDNNSLIGFHIDFSPEYGTRGQFFVAVRKIYRLYREAKNTRRIREVKRGGSNKRRLFYFHLDNLKPLSELLEVSRRFHQVSDELLSVMGLTKIAA